VAVDRLDTHYRLTLEALERPFGGGRRMTDTGSG
jgi:hypothetical protein